MFAWLTRPRLIAVTAALLAAGGALAILSGREDAAGGVRTALDPVDPGSVALGEDIYRAQCAACHGANLQGQFNWRSRGPDGRLPAPPHDETGHTWHHPDRVLFELTKYGLPDEIGGAPYASNMPAFEGTLTDGQILAVLSFIKSRWPESIRQQHDAVNARVNAAAP